MSEAGSEETAEFRTLDAPTQQLPAVIPAMAHVSPDVTTHRPGLARRWLWPLLVLAAAALASIPIALFGTSDGPSSPRGQAPPLQWPPDVSAVSESPAPSPSTPEAPVAPPPAPPPAEEEAAPPRGTTSPSPPPTPATPTSYEAEARGNRLGGRAAPRELDGASGGSVVGWVGEGRDNTLTFTGVTTVAAGPHRVTIYYVSRERRAAAVEVNGAFATVVDFPPTGGWDTVGSTTITLTLRAGPNEIQFGNRWSWAPDFDRLVTGGLAR
ncbi:hypothetical protein ACTMTJ_43230 [Phytohabitans sp. LJ34]|uniref:hypothetical protein n=1 Tax=Phytohabitans sp. LJ34 TaxID=3452217 RepID=UPI003F8C8A3F